MPALPRRSSVRASSARLNRAASWPTWEASRLVERARKDRIARPPRRHQQPAHQEIAVEHEAEAALDRLAAAVATRAVLLQDRLGFLPTRRRSARPRRPG